MLNLIFLKSVNPRLRRVAVLVVILLAMGFGLGGCGKKAGHVDPPASVVNDTFPQTYPDPATDPKP